MIGSSNACGHHATTVGYVESALEGSGERGRPLIDLEREVLVEPECAGGVLGVDAEHRVRHTGGAQAPERLGRHRPGQPTPSPSATNADLLEPAPLDAEALILVGPDPVLDDAGDLIAVPGDDPEVGVEVGLLEQRLALGLV